MSNVFVGKSALVAENDALIAMDLTDTLRNLGLNVHEVRSVEAAIAYLLPMIDQPHVSILDGQLADGDVKAVATLLRSRGLPFIFTTGNPSKVRDWGFGVPIVSKPFSAESLSEALHLAMTETGIRL